MKKLTALTIYSIAMGYLEASVVIYIRLWIFGNPGQVFPLSLMSPRIAILEVVRELATIVMLGMVSILGGKDKFERWLMFIFCFAVWDIVYYLSLKVLVGWPPSLLTPDVLFLIPVVWIGPVLSPILVAALLGFSSIMFLRIRRKNREFRIASGRLWFFALGCAGVLYSFTEDIFHILLTEGPKGLENYTPKTFDWGLFIAGYVVMCAVVLYTITKSYHKMGVDDSGRAESGNDKVIQ